MFQNQELLNQKYAELQCYQDKLEEIFLIPEIAYRLKLIADSLNWAISNNEFHKIIYEIDMVGDFVESHQ